MNPRSYLACLALFALLGVAAVITAGVIIDPYGLFNVVSIPKINAEKTDRLARGGRFIKSIDISRRDFDTLILGSSRTMQGIHPDSPAFHGHSAYNAAIAGTDMLEMYKIGCFALEQHRFRLLVIGIDLHMFLTPQSLGGDFSTSAFTGQPVPLVVLRRLLSIAAVVDSGKTVIKNALGWRSAFLANGAVDQGRILQKPDHRAWFQWRLDRITQALQGRHYLPSTVKDLKDLIVRARRLGVDVRVFISPTHAVHLEILSSLGFFPVFEQWKRDVTKAIAEANRVAAPGDSVQLWDFSGYNRVTTEPIPGPGDHTPMRWYWELSHYKRAAGDLILDRILQSGSSTGRESVRDFGVQLTEDNLEEHLASIRAAQTQYRDKQLHNSKNLAVRPQRGIPSPN